MSYTRDTQSTVTLTVCNADVEDVFKDMARVHFHHRPDIKAGRILTLEYNGVFVPLVARGSHSNQKGVIAIDLETRERLGDLRLGEAYEFKIHPATWAECLSWAWGATDPGYRIASRVALVSFILGVIGLVLGVASLIHS